MYEIKTDRNELVPEVEVQEFYDELKSSNFLVLEKEFDNVVYNSLDWLIPSAFVVYIFKPYFEAFLKEAGKDHYKALKKAIADKVAPKFLCKNAPCKVRKVTANGVINENFFSGSFSISSSINYSGKAVKIKLLFPENSDGDYTTKAIDKFSHFVSSYTDKSLGDLLQKESKFPISTSCFWYNLEADKIELLDIVESSRQKQIISTTVQ
ncbi:hypothetical protein JYT13_00970 [Mariprofundus ferrooxydans]|nr:hypothetical protein [Mariprofundus ferrooxydans]